MHTYCTLLSEWSERCHWNSNADPNHAKVPILKCYYNIINNTGFHKIVSHLPIFVRSSKRKPVPCFTMWKLLTFFRNEDSWRISAIYGRIDSAVGVFRHVSKTIVMWSISRVAALLPMARLFSLWNWPQSSQATLKHGLLISLVTLIIVSKGVCCCCCCCCLPARQVFDWT